MTVSVVIPTYNGQHVLGQTLDALLASDLKPARELEIIVVDDGSPVPAEPIVQERARHAPFDVCCIRQPNGGPGAARNTGFRASRGDVVIFIDDDILVPPDLLEAHIAAHDENPDAVLFGLSTLARIEGSPAWERYLTSLTSPPAIGAHSTYLEAQVASSGHLSVLRDCFQEGAVYTSLLETVGGEEFELAYRVKCQGLRLLLAPRIVAVHNETVSLTSYCEQQYKYGLGCAEVAIRHSETGALPELHRILTRNYVLRSTSCRFWTAGRFLRVGASGHRCRKSLAALIRCLDRISPYSQQLFVLYRWLIGSYFCAGIWDGMRRFGGMEARSLGWPPVLPARSEA